MKRRNAEQRWGIGLAVASFAGGALISLSQLVFPVVHYAGLLYATSGAAIAGGIWLMRRAGRDPEAAKQSTLVATHETAQRSSNKLDDLSDTVLGAAETIQSGLDATRSIAAGTMTAVVRTEASVERTEASSARIAASVDEGFDRVLDEFRAINERISTATHSAERSSDDPNGLKRRALGLAAEIGEFFAKREAGYPTLEWIPQRPQAVHLGRIIHPYDMQTALLFHQRFGSAANAFHSEFAAKNLHDREFDQSRRWIPGEVGNREVFAVMNGLTTLAESLDASR